MLIKNKPKPYIKKDRLGFLTCLYNVNIVNGRVDGWGFIIIGIGGSSGGNW